MMFFYLALGVLSLATGTPRTALNADDEAQNYLMNFGYLPRSDSETRNLIDGNQLTEAIKKLQKYGGIPETGVIDAATKTLMRTPRCGLPDEPNPGYKKKHSRRFKRFALQEQKWPRQSLTWSLRNNGGLDRGGVRREVYRALDLWAQNSKLTFHEVESNDADILISFESRDHGDGRFFDGKGGVLAHAFYPGEGRGGDAHFDEEETWLLQDDVNEGTNFFAVAAHEFGHSLGLGHSPLESAIMYPWHTGFIPNDGLPEDDRLGIQQLYGASDIQPGPEPNPPPKYRTTQTPHRHYTTPKSDVPDKCDTNYDAISVIRGETFIFKSRYFWRIGREGLYKVYPIEITRLFHFPTDIDRVDAVYERPDDKIVFFIGQLYYVFNAKDLEPGYPKSLTSLGLPENLDKIDGAVVWGSKSKTHFFSGNMYWRFDESTKQVEVGYPKDMSVFAGVGYNIDAVFKHKDGKTYFFKDKGFWEFDDEQMKVVLEKPRSSAQVWMGCSRELETTTIDDMSTQTIDVDMSTPIVHPSSGKSSIAATRALIVLFLCHTLFA